MEAVDFNTVKEPERLKIQIEIQNNIMERMDIDEDLEEGQLSDPNESMEAQTEVSTAKFTSTTNRVWNNLDMGFATGVNIFDKDEQEKLQERASRFGLKPNEIANFTDDDLMKLHESLGVCAENEKNVRFEAIHMRGTDEMSTEDVFRYFEKYGPAGIEWINDESCNVVWLDKISAARALYFMSKLIKGMPSEGPCDPFVEKDAEKEKNENRSILLINKEREVELEKEEDTEANSQEYVSISDINAAIPPGYWRLGEAHPKGKYILLRFALKIDKKPLRAERFSEYYKKYGNPNYGGMRGIITDSRRKKFKGIFERNKDIVTVADTKNPWGELAENWDADERFCEKVEPIVPVQREVVTKGNSDILKRLGVKRPQESDEESTSSEEKVETKKSKIPRMRMYADEEEEKLKRKKQLLEIKLNHADQQEKPRQVQDLRAVIGVSTKKVVQESRDVDIDEEEDLGARLKNRTRVKVQESVQHGRLDYNRTKEVLVKQLQKPIEVRDREQRRRHKSPPPRKRNEHSDYDRSMYRNKLHSDRYKSRRKSSSEEDFDHNKPKSKVAVVIKTQRKPTVASTIWSRITPKKERLKTASERQGGQESSSSSDSSSDSDTSSESSEESDDEAKENVKATTSLKSIERPGFNSTNGQRSAGISRKKSPLRIEINNDRFKEE